MNQELIERLRDHPQDANGNTDVVECLLRMSEAADALEGGVTVTDEMVEAYKTAYGEYVKRWLQDDLTDPTFDATRAALEAALSAPAQRVEEGPHPDDVAVDRFAAAMKAKLAKKRDEGRGGWEGPTCNMEFLSKLLREHVEKGDPLDVGNLAMMLYQRGERIASPAPQRVEEARGLRLERDLLLKAILYYYGPEGAQKITTAVLAEREKAHAASPAPAPHAGVDVDVAELARLVKDAELPELHAAGGYLTVRDPDGGSFSRSIYHLDELGQSEPMQPFQAVPFARPEHAKAIATVVNALRAVLENRK